MNIDFEEMRDKLGGLYLLVVTPIIEKGGINGRVKEAVNNSKVK